MKIDLDHDERCAIVDALLRRAVNLREAAKGMGGENAAQHRGSMIAEALKLEHLAFRVETIHQIRAAFGA